MSDQPTLKIVNITEILEKDFCLELTFNNGFKGIVDLTEKFKEYPFFEITHSYL